MPVDIVPLHKLPECIQKSLTSAPDEKANIFRIYDVMSASATVPQRCQLSKSPGPVNNNQLVDKSPWWSRLFPPKESHRRQIVQKLIDDVDQRNPAHPASFNEASTPVSDLDSDFSFVCSVCESSFLSHDCCRDTEREPIILGVQSALSASPIRRHCTTTANCCLIGQRMKTTSTRTSSSFRRPAMMRSMMMID